MNKVVIAIMFSQIAPVVKTIPGKFKKYALPVLTLRIEPPCAGRFARWCARSAFYAGEPPALIGCVKPDSAAVIRSDNTFL